MKAWRRRIIPGICMWVLLFPAALSAERAIPEEHVRYPVLVSFERGPAATGFYVNNRAGEAYFVTARHILFSQDAAGNFVPKGNKVLLLSYPREQDIEEPLYLELQMEQLVAQGNTKTHDAEDVAVVRIGRIHEGPEGKELVLMPGVVQKVEPGKGARGTLLGAGLEVIKKYDDVNVGNDVFIFGYPISIGVADYPQMDYMRPLLRRGSIAGKNDAKKTIILDCPIVYGNSGGPVVEVERTSLTETRFSVIGVISEFIPFDEGWYSGRMDLGRGIQNSGYSVVIPMDPVLEMIEPEEGLPSAPA